MNGKHQRYFHDQRRHEQQGVGLEVGAREVFPADKAERKRNSSDGKAPNRNTRPFAMPVPR